MLEAIESILTQDIPQTWDLRAAVVDDGSSDGTGDALAAFPADERLHYIRQENSERGAARNRGARWCRLDMSADWILFFDSDDWLIQGALRAYVEKIETCQSDVVAVWSQIELWNGIDKQAVLPPAANQPDGDISMLALTRQILPLGATLIRGEAYDQLGGFSENRLMSGSEDFEFLVRLALLGPVAHLPLRTVLYRQHASNTNPHHYLQSTELATRALRLPLLQKWPGHEGLAAYRKIQMLAKLSQIGALNKGPFASAALHSLISFVSMQPWRIFTPTVHRLAFSILRTWGREKIKMRRHRISERPAR